MKKLLPLWLRLQKASARHDRRPSATLSAPAGVAAATTLECRASQDLEMNGGVLQRKRQVRRSLVARTDQGRTDRGWEVDERSIVDVRPEDLRGFRQCHFFAGIGGWSLALRLAGWPDDREVWTGSCPCQPW